MKARVLKKFPPNAAGAEWWHLQAVEGRFAAQPAWGEGPQPEGWEFVIASGCNTLDHGPEVYLFPADDAGKVVSWEELPDSYVGTRDIAWVLAEAGIELVD